MTSPDARSPRYMEAYARLGPYRWLVAWAVAATMLALAASQLDWRQVVVELALLKPAWVVAAVAMNFTILPLWATLWKLLLPNAQAVPFGRVFKITAAMSTVANTVPFMAGHAAGVHLLATRGGTGHATALSVMALEQFAEGIAKITLLASLALLAPLPPALRSGLAVLLPGTLLLAVVLWVAAHSLPDVNLDQSDEWHRTLAWLARFARRWGRRLEAIRRPGIMLVACVVAITMKVAEGVAILMGQWALGIDLPASSAILVLASVHLATMIPVAPANLGVYEAACFAAYLFIGVDPATAAALALVHHVLLLLPMAGTGPLVLLQSKGMPRV